MTVMMRSMLEVADNSGARKLQMILPLGGATGLRAGLGDVITASVKEAAPDGQTKKGTVVKAVIVRTRKEHRRRDGIADRAQRQVRGGQRHAQRARGQQHDRVRRMRARREVFGVAGEVHAGVVDDALLHRRRDHGGELATQAAVDGAIQHAQHVARIGGIELAGDAGRAERDVDDFEAAGFAAEQTGALGQQCLAADDHQFGGEAGLFKCQAKVRTDAGGFTGGDGDA